MLPFVQRLVRAFIVSHVLYFMDFEQRDRAVVFRYRKKLWVAVEAMSSLDNGTQHAEMELKRSSSYNIDVIAMPSVPLLSCDLRRLSPTRDLDSAQGKRNYYLLHDNP